MFFWIIREKGNQCAAVGFVHLDAEHGGARVVVTERVLECYVLVERRGHEPIIRTCSNTIFVGLAERPWQFHLAESTVHKLRWERERKLVHTARDGANGDREVRHACVDVAHALALEHPVLDLGGALQLSYHVSIDT